MLRRRTTVCLCMLGALLAGVLAAQGAVAATNGKTAFTCKERKEAGGAGFSKAHCTNADAVGSGAKFEHVQIASGTTTEVSVSNETTGGSTPPLASKNTMGGVAVPFTATKVTGSGSLENAVDAGTGEHYIHGEGVLTFTGMDHYPSWLQNLHRQPRRCHGRSGRDPYRGSHHDDQRARGLSEDRTERKSHLRAVLPEQNAPTQP